MAEAGVRETVVDGESGVLVGADTAEFAAAIDRVAKYPWTGSDPGRAGARPWFKTGWTVQAAGRRLEAALVEVATLARRSTLIGSHYLVAKM